jgi:NCAIR mutase (PurE)-related protein
MLEIQRAHTAQQVYVQSLQEKLSDISRYRSTIKIQEKIIRKFESLLNESNQEREQTLQDQNRERERRAAKENVQETPKVQEIPVQVVPPELVVNHNALVASLERENKMLLSKIHDLQFSLEKAQLEPTLAPPVQAKDDTLELFKMELEAERDA